MAFSIDSHAHSTSISTFLILALFAAATQLVYHHRLGAEAASMQVMVPAYFNPTGNAAAWAALNSAASSLPNRVVAIANPSNGPSTSQQSDYVAAISSLHSASGRVVGYVYSGYGNRALASVKADIDSWYAFYSIDGIFIDEVANTDGEQSYYQQLYQYIKSKNSSSLVVNNPGTSTLSSYLFYNGTRVADVICVFESSGAAALQWTTQSWTSSYDPSNFLALAYNTSDVDVEDFDYGDVIDHAYQQRAGWVYVTSDTLPNPWDTVPSYFSNEIEYIAEDNYLP
ncbi:hypothetical protein KP509_09G038000 [Ceratopteris richardii]|uniref:Spherulation-specific family 4 n=1 Tax=Ceratopteris richardii TaxID=49495 RepID=A0A8T2U5P1_CERRI|nr:hypothetical protein KP509_09G038000 [Ceratopteris richardii]